MTNVKRADLNLPQAHAPASNRLEEELSQCFTEALNLDQVGIDDDFFDLGGDSLAAERLYLLAQERELPPFPVVKLFTLGTVRKLAAWILSQQNTAVAADDVDNPPNLGAPEI